MIIDTRRDSSRSLWRLRRGGEGMLCICEIDDNSIPRFDCFSAFRTAQIKGIDFTIYWDLENPKPRCHMKRRACTENQICHPRQLKQPLVK